ncbi:Adhesion G-protein coupled receptor G4 [Holothuria leucospilota]|uniref:Adhesion G-protein coupled receptor G4 n=1 Tax=Holothuria leucospilota TaxID=206669 RepID=A0A9Q0YEB8_HOLLE|nr:Adhesion G-protein coupled receptor G4 [Holothuria leucospilota]
MNRKFRQSQPKKITLNLCVALLGLYCSFPIGINLTHSGTICTIFGGVIHLFCLSSMAWMSVEATQLYLLFVKILNAHVRNFLKTAAFIAWGLPIVVVVICVAVRPDDYGHEYCFPKRSSLVFYIGVLGLLAVMLAYNIVIYITIIWNLRATRRNISQSQTTRNGVIGRIQNAFAISVLVGLSWCFGFLQAVESLRLLFNVLFCLFNSLQGVFIFLIFCLREKDIRAAWRNWFGIKTCQTKRARNASSPQDKLKSTSKDGTTEKGTKRKTTLEASAEVQQFELMETEDIYHDIQTTAMSTFQSQ